MPLILLRTTKPYDKLKLITTLQAQTSAQIEGRERIGIRREAEPRPAPPQPDLNRSIKPSLNARHYFLDDSSRKHMFLVDDRTVIYVFGELDCMLEYSMQMLKPAEKGPLDAALLQAAKNHSVVAGVNGVAIAAYPELAPAIGQLGLKSLLAAKTATLVIDVKETITATMDVTATDAASAKAIKELVSDYLRLAKAAMPSYIGEAKKTDATETASYFLGLLELGLSKVEYKLTDSSATITTTVAFDGEFAKKAEAFVKLSQLRRAKHGG